MFKIDALTSRSTQQPLAEKTTMAQKAQRYIMSEGNYSHTYLKGYLEYQGIEIKPVPPFQYTTSEQEDIYYVDCPSDEDIKMFNSIYLDPFDANKDGKLSYAEYAEEQNTMFSVDEYRDLLKAKFGNLDKDKNELDFDEDIEGTFGQDPATIDANTKAKYKQLYVDPYDKDKSETLNEEEYIARYAKEAGLVAGEEGIADKFASYNADGDEFISEKENMLWLCPDILKAPTPEAKKAYLENASEMVESQISLYDGVDGDGQLSFDEYNTKREYEHYNLNPAHEYGRVEMTEYDKDKTALEFENLDINGDDLIQPSELTMLYALQDCDGEGVINGAIDYGFLATDVVGLSDPNTKQFLNILAEYFGI